MPVSLAIRDLLFPYSALRALNDPGPFLGTQPFAVGIGVGFRDLDTDHRHNGPASPASSRLVVQVHGLIARP